MENKLYDWTSEWYFRYNLPKVFALMKDGVSHDSTGQRIATGEENKHLEPWFGFYDSEKLLNDVYELLTRKRHGLTTESTVKSIDDFVRDVEETPRRNRNDLTRLYSHESGKMKVTSSKVKNSYDGVNEDDLIERLPSDFMSPDGSIENGAVGSALAAALVNTEKFPKVGAVLAKTTEYILGGKVVHVRNGRIVEERFATGYDAAQNVLYIDHVVHNAGKPAVSKEMFDYNNPSRGIMPLGASIQNPCPSCYGMLAYGGAR